MFLGVVVRNTQRRFSGWVGVTLVCWNSEFGSCHDCVINSALFQNFSV